MYQTQHILLMLLLYVLLDPATKKATHHPALHRIVRKIFRRHINQLIKQKTEQSKENKTTHSRAAGLTRTALPAAALGGIHNSAGLTTTAASAAAAATLLRATDFLSFPPPPPVPRFRSPECRARALIVPLARPSPPPVGSLALISPKPRQDAMGSNFPPIPCSIPRRYVRRRGTTP